MTQECPIHSCTIILHPKRRKKNPFACESWNQFQERNFKDKGRERRRLGHGEEDRRWERQWLGHKEEDRGRERKQLGHGEKR